MSPFTIRGIDLKFVPVWPDSRVSVVDPNAVLTQMPMSTAGFLSARFPWLTPAGWFDDTEDETGGLVGPLEKIRVVDGGYFENSGIVTAMDVVDTIEDAINSDEALIAFRDKVELNLITLNSKEFNVHDFYGLGEILAPISTMLSTRSARAPIETARAQRLLIAKPPGKAGTESPSVSVSKNLLRFDLYGLGYPLPLGWRLSPVTRLLISYQLGFREKCEVETLAELSRMVSPDVDCLRQLLFRQLTGG